MYQQLSQERHLLRISVYGALFFAISGIVFGIISGAQMIVFDGLYSLISLILSTISLFASHYMRKTDIKNFPFGKDKIEPLVIIIKYLVILVLVVSSFTSAVMALLSGGREVDINLALVYSVLSTILCIGITFYLKSHAKKSKSGLLHAEANQWVMDSLVSLGVVVGFIISLIFTNLPALSGLIPYIDPIMVVIVSVYFVKVPISEMGSGLREILDMPPKGKMPDQIKQHIKTLKTTHEFKEAFTRVSKVGQTLWVEVDFVAEIDNEIIETISEQDSIREDIHQYLSQYPYEIWLTVSFTEDRKWAI
ncbi:cobalt-zinc-cadmium resistance protein [Halolactibacillus alkaliphilus]|uniref:Cobalt-zinc-cadmium resistance protein n=1 Tax=Halolactibacillus alkaliphilus TaxID=442899 RepID=A0A511X2W3_9BACI|nr:cation diffusion facilitator family transporter [Halolactibacillus alkaliphilus]GEN57282.1 cobalt-zinc-cadmium resistance protein [Halolactibacillus alkaliphilus]GGN72474.1 cobalt-zinc-cadmium resistance protein [Halolactibacillus alkaliphilus]SFO89717.1 cation diffusion facilitator family transporter [Halolactibacillus alkaliphilus]